MALTNFLSNSILTNRFTNGTTYLALHTADPTNAGLANTELTVLTAPTYTRKAVTWSTASNRSVMNSAIINWSGLPILSIGYLACWDAVTGGNMLAVFPCARPLSVTTSGGSIYLPLHSVTVIIGGSPGGTLDGGTFSEDPLNPGTII